MSDKISRRLLLAARTPSVDYGTYDLPVDEVPIPPTDAEVLPTACEYCIVCCGYKVYRWPYQQRGGSKAADNAFGVDFRSSLLPASGSARTCTTWCVTTASRTTSSSCPMANRP